MISTASLTSGSAAMTLDRPASKLAHRSSVPRIREIERLIQSVVATWSRNEPLLENRRWHRVRHEVPILVTPLSDCGTYVTDDSKLAHSRDIALGGISFMHESPLPSRLVAITFAGNEHESVVTRLSWCRFTRQRVYRSGGQFVCKLELPALHPAAWDRLARA